jgi:hypothetical protein
MALFELDGRSTSHAGARPDLSSRHVRRAQTMLLAAVLATLGIVAVAGTLLTRLF